ncbi:MFS transporter, DHA1 family, inner membrane transport protein [Halobiforma haloterrestris]|uniref:MFS transporter, DHA1 family, inner membrane transport protein n=1 Tax=Natronobacterium haloterrestre TaxID=148448 RepID=A0A1I1HYS3_NATHA|nr:MFS transporter [Halobiforma haloterrestris]SFC28935.1 MFS transporter, DHA1 family, inner membrane transport protein [Halobiforma haloterrestris]
MSTLRSRATSEQRPLPWAAIAAVGTGLFGLGLAVGGYGAYVSLLIARGVSPDAAGLGMSLFLFGQFAAVVPADLLTRRTAVERVAAAGFVLAGIGIGLGAVLTLEATYASRLLLGLGQGAAFVAGMKYVGLRTTGADTATAQGMLGALFTLGLAVGLAAGPVVVPWAGPALPTVGAAGVALAGGAFTARLATVGPDARTVLGAYLEPFTSAGGLALGFGNVATFGFLMVASTWYAEVVAGAALPGTAVLVGFALATVVGRGVGGWLSRTYGERATVGGTLLGLALVLLGLAAAIDVDSAAGIAAGLVLTGFGFGVPFGPLFGLAFSELADDAGVTLSGMMLVGNGAALAYPWLVGRLLAATDGYAAGFAAMGATVGAIWLCWRRTVGG